jgi:putative endonuclease
MNDRRQRLGRRGERLAQTHLEERGYTVLETNYHIPSGEIDLVVEKDGQLVFVEVRTRTGTALGSPEESITETKRSRLADCAQEYLEAVGAAGAEWRIDVVALEVDPNGRVLRLDVVQNAVEL